MQMTGAELVFTNAIIVGAAGTVTGTVLVRNGTIASVDTGRCRLRMAIDCGGDLLVPGLVELHTDNVERHLQPRPGADWPVNAAVLSHDREMAAAGITTVLNALCVGEVHSKALALHYLSDVHDSIERYAALGYLKADHYFHWRCEVGYPDLPALIGLLIDRPGVRLLSVMDHTPGQRQYADPTGYAAYYQGKFGMTDAELEGFVADRRRDRDRYAAPHRAHVASLARDRNIPLASHDDATGDHVAEAVRDRVTIAEFPTTMDAARACNDYGLRVLMGGPNIVRGGSHSGNVSALDLARRGFLDIVSSDYVPSSLLWGALKLQRQAGLPLWAAIATATRTPALAAGFGDRGEIAPGLRADLVRVMETESVPIVRGVWRGGKKIA